MAECALSVLNRLMVGGKIARYAIVGPERTWTGEMPRSLEAVDILVALPQGPLSDGADEGYLIELLRAEGYSDRGDYGVKVEGWDIRFIVSASDLSSEALDHAMERQFTIRGSKSPVTSWILQVEYFAALMLSWDTIGHRNWVIELIEEDEVDVEALREIVSRHKLKGSWCGSIH